VTWFDRSARYPTLTEDERALLENAVVFAMTVSPIILLVARAVGNRCLLESINRSRELLYAA